MRPRVFPPSGRKRNHKEPSPPVPDRCYRLALCDITPNADLDPSTVRLGCHASSTSLELCQLAPQLWVALWLGTQKSGYQRQSSGASGCLDLSQKESVTRVHFYPFSVQVILSRGTLHGSPSPTSQHRPVSTFCGPKWVSSFLSHGSLYPRKSKSSCLSFPPAHLSVNPGKNKSCTLGMAQGQGHDGCLCVPRVQALLKITTAQTSLLQLHCLWLKEPGATCARQQMTGRTEPKLIRKSAGSPPPSA